MFFSKRSWFFTCLHFFWKVVGCVVVVDFDSNTSTAKLWLALGLSLATKYKIIFDLVYCNFLSYVRPLSYARLRHAQKGFRTITNKWIALSKMRGKELSTIIVVTTYFLFISSSYTSISYFYSFPSSSSNSSPFLPNLLLLIVFLLLLFILPLLILHQSLWFILRLCYAQNTLFASL